MARHNLSEMKWRLIEPLLPSKPRGVARAEDRRMINGTFYVLRTGSDLPLRNSSSWSPFDVSQALRTEPHRSFRP